MSFVREILKDYGSACAKIGSYLSVQNCSTIQEIAKGTGMEVSLIHLGLSILLQRRIVSYVIYDRSTYYNVDKEMATRRLYFNIYARYVQDRFECYKAFLKILLSGTSKISNCKENVASLVNQGIIKEIARKDIKFENENSNKRQNVKLFYVVDFEVLDKLIVDLHMLDFLRERYSNSMREIYRAVCKSTVVDTANVLTNLESTKLLVKDGISYLNDTANIGEYLKYLCNLGVINKDFDGESHYKKKIDKCLDLIKIKEMCLILENNGSRRLLNMFYEIGSLEDSEVGKKSLLPSAEVKNSIFILHKYGCINLEYSGEGGKHASIWRFNNKAFSRAITKIVEDTIVETVGSINEAWETGNIFENESFLIDISKLHYLAEKHFVLSKTF
ncbi:hypothetical protein NGRA_1761 [Nosema granulosis]|uniref:DNA-directed RNA polymerase III subunit RPC3 n=1 Tax=Nosema granulosis TaxID=83296 RepID=A0A9P6GXW1_9MICR|nr:hypothetical protein NGRA_1761 [Nosema granulosis]